MDQYYEQLLQQQQQQQQQQQHLLTTRVTNYSSSDSSSSSSSSDYNSSDDDDTCSDGYAASVSSSSSCAYQQQPLARKRPRGQRPSKLQQEQPTTFATFVSSKKHRQVLSSKFDSSSPDLSSMSNISSSSSDDDNDDNNDESFISDSFSDEQQQQRSSALLLVHYHRKKIPAATTTFATSSSANKRIKYCCNNNDVMPTSSLGMAAKVTATLAPPRLSSPLSSKLDRAVGRRIQGGGSRQHQHQQQTTCYFSQKQTCLKKAATAVSATGMMKHPIFNIGCDTMSHCMSYLQPVDIYDILTMTICKEWYKSFTKPQELWKVLCLSDPFYSPSSSSSSSQQQQGRQCYRLLYTSFIRCIKYLDEIKNDTVMRRSGGRSSRSGSSSSAAAVARNSAHNNQMTSIAHQHHHHQATAAPPRATPSSSSSSSTRNDNTTSDKKKSSSTVTGGGSIKYSRSSLSQNLLGPSSSVSKTTGHIAVGDLNLPWSCSIYSILNWMTTYTEVEGIQTLCLQVFPFLLEDETQRTVAQNAGLTRIILCCMVNFPNSVKLHTAAFHAMVILTRPIGGREGMIFHNSMVSPTTTTTAGATGNTASDSSTRNNKNSFDDDSNNNESNNKNKRNGLVVLLNSMKRFENEERLQAMSCWSLVNISLIPSQKSSLVKLGGIASTINAMKQHPLSAEVQFRALFALINLVIPSKKEDNNNNNDNQTTTTSHNNNDEPTNNNNNNDDDEKNNTTTETTEKEMLDMNVTEIVNLVVVAMKNFCTVPTILNRACLVLHNLSLTKEYRSTMLWTPMCYQILDWSIQSYPNDTVLQKSAKGTISRLQLLLGSNSSSGGESSLRNRFTSFLQRTQQQEQERQQVQ